MDEISYEISNSAATNQAVINRDKRGRFANGNIPSTGFHTNPERRCDGRWNKNNSIPYWYNKLLGMTDEEFDEFTPSTQAQNIAKMRIERAMRDDPSSLAETKEITDRTEGKAKYDISTEAEAKTNPIIRVFVIPTMPEGYIDNEIAKARLK